MPFGKKKKSGAALPAGGDKPAQTGALAAGKTVHTREMPAVSAADAAAPRKTARSADGASRPGAPEAAQKAPGKATKAPPAGSWAPAVTWADGPKGADEMGGGQSPAQTKTADAHGSGAAANGKGPAVQPARGNHERKPPAGKAQAQKQAAAKPAARRKQRKKGPLGRLGAAIAALPPFHALGNMFYALGFFGELILLRIWRVLRNAGLFIGQLLGVVLGSVFRTIGHGLRTFWRDITAPFVRFGHGISTARAVVREEKQKKDGRPVRAAVGYLGSGVKMHGHLALNLAGLVLPLLALAALSVTAYSILSADYGLAVTVNGEVLGYVTDQGVVDDAKSLLRMRLRLAEDQTQQDWQLNPTVAVARTSTFSTKQQLVNDILRSGSSDIVDGTGLVINGELVAVTTEGDRLRAYLDSQLAAYGNLGEGGGTVSFVKDVVCDPAADDVFFASSVKSYSEIIEMISRIEKPEEVFAADGQVTLGDIASTTGVPVEEIIQRNPRLAGQGADFVPVADTNILVQPAQPYLQVQVVYQESQVEVIEHPVEQIENDQLYKGQEKVTQEGVDGEQRVLYNYIYIDGLLDHTERVDGTEEVITAPVAEIVEVGTKERGSVYGYDEDGNPIAMPTNLPPVSGGYMWPVPGYAYSSRGMAQGHRGQDINAATGTPIYAANSGVVVFAGWHYSYGYYVQIAHADGYSTLYAHCSALFVTAGQTVSQGEAIAAVGSTGNSSGPHCHFEIHGPNGELINPLTMVSPPHGLGTA